MVTVRSPKYPAISLPDAINKITLIYQQEHKHPANREVIAKAIGYGGINGASSSIISALHKYGLLEHIGGDQFRVSEDAIDIILSSLGEPERLKAIRRVAFNPSLFNELHKLHGDTLPSDQNIRIYLLKRDFNPKTVDSVIRSYRDTIEFVNVETEGSEELDPAEDIQTEVSMQTSSVKQPSANSSANNVLRSEISIPASLEHGSNESVIWFKLSEECEVRAIFAGKVTQEAIDKFIKYLDLSKDTYPTKASIEQEPAKFDDE